MKLLLVQFNSDMLTKDENPQAKAYYDKLYRTRPGYYRLGPTWEIPQWMAEMQHNFPEADVLFADSVDDVLSEMWDYTDLAFSALDCNWHYIRTVALNFEGHIFVGGYCDPDNLNDLENVFWCDSIKNACNWFARDYKPGINYEYFTGTKTIARLAMSNGCLHHCKFCTVSDEVVPVHHDLIVQALGEIATLGSPLIYLNDKTFGQCWNHRALPKIYYNYRLLNPNFGGFIIQTTVSQLLKLSNEFLLTSGIRYVELGVESYNDDILKVMRKPANCDTIDRAVNKLRNLGISVIPNIMIGLPGETRGTYQSTISWLVRNIDVISHVNVYTYVDYGNTNCVDENRGGDTYADKDFAEKLYRFGAIALDKGAKR